MAEVCNPYPDETESLKVMPASCPLLLLPYGLLSEKIMPLVQQKIRSIREDKRKTLIKEISLCRLNDLVDELFKRVTLDPCQPMVNISACERLYKRTTADFMCKIDVPPFFLEETLQEQQRSITTKPYLTLGAWVECYGRAPLNESFGTYIGMGVVTRASQFRSGLGTGQPPLSKIWGTVRVGLLHKSARVYADDGNPSIAFKQQILLGEVCCKVVDPEDVSSDMHEQLSDLAKQFEGALCHRCLFPMYVCYCQ